MRYTYAYKTRDGIRHEAKIDAPNRDVAFTRLRELGIRPIKVVASDGSKANGEVRGIRKRVAAGLVALTALIVAIGMLLYVRTFRTTQGEQTFQTSTTRRQIIGDSAVVAKGILTGWSDVFSLEGDRFLASFAIPGVKAGQRSTTEAELRKVLDETTAHEPLSTDSLEARQIRAMVEGMKQEARRYIAAGGTLVGYGNRLTERQDLEVSIYERAKAEIERARECLSNDEFLALWEKRNNELRNLGIRLVPLD